MVLEAGEARYGDDAAHALATALSSAKVAGPLDAATVVVDRSSLRLATRRRLAAVPPGIANVRFSTWSELAALLASDQLVGGDRPMVTPALVLEAVRTVLVSRPPIGLEGAASQPSTLRAVARTYGELAAVPDGALEAVARQSPRARAIIEVVRAVRGALAGCTDVAGLLGAAAAGVRADPERTRRALGTVIAYLPRRLGPAELGLLEALACHLDVQVILGTTGDDAADAHAHALCARLGGQPVPRAPARAHATDVWSAPSADAEVLLALRHLMWRNAQGVPLERMALLYGGAPPYPRLVHDAVAVAGIPTYGSPARPLAATVAGRVLLGVLGLGDHDWRRDDVMAWITGAPLLDAGRAVPSAEWDALSRDAGVVGGLVHWDQRLSEHARLLRADARRATARAGDDLDAEERAARLAEDARHCEELRDFVERVGVMVGRDAPTQGASAPTWAAWAEWGGRVLDAMLGDRSRHGDWPEDEVHAFDEVAEVLGSLGALDWLGAGAPSAADFRVALAAELDRPAPSTARFGRGLLVGRVPEAVGLDLDVVWVVGLVDGAFPAPVHDDVLLPDRERARGGDAVPLRGPSAADARRDYLAALAGARTRIVSTARFDQRRGRALRAPRLLLDDLQSLAGTNERLGAGDLHGSHEALSACGAYGFVTSYAEAARGTGDAEPLSGDDWRLRALVDAVMDGCPVTRHPLVGEDGVLAGALEARRERRRWALTRFDGLVPVSRIPALAARVQSATAIETYARCPRRYLFERVLRVATRERPETAVELSPRERGVFVHAVLERLVREELAGAPGPSRDPGGDAEARMLAHVRQAFADLERDGAPGAAAIWELEQWRITSDLRRHLRDDAAYRQATGAVPIAVEMAFGATPDTAVEVGTVDGGPVRFRGTVDRVDRLADGRLAVIDYKSGRPFGDDHGDPLAGGTRVQLPIYASAARARFDATDVQAGYWHVGVGPVSTWREIDEEVEGRLREVVGTVAVGVEGGLFPGRPGPTDPRHPRGAGCRFCPYDAVCPPDRASAWRRTREDPVLEDYRAMVGDDDQ